MAKAIILAVLVAALGWAASTYLDHFGDIGAVVWIGACIAIAAFVDLRQGRLRRSTEAQKEHGAERLNPPPHPAPSATAPARSAALRAPETPVSGRSLP
jgi:hypothetical protein